MRLRLTVAAVVFLAACQDVRHHRLVINPSPGFQCWVPSMMPMQSPQARPTIAEAILGKDGRPFSLVIDFIAVGGQPDCRLPGLVHWCMENTCAPIASVRQCLTLDPTPIVRQGHSVDMAVAATLSSLAGTPVTSDAPLEPVIIRAFAAGESCDALTDVNVRPMMGFGCAFSCPVDLGARDGDVTLDLDFFGRFQGDQDCGGLVAFCLSPNLQPPPG